jgi:hypothetical protein
MHLPHRPRTLPVCYFRATKNAECRHFIAPLLVLRQDNNFSICPLVCELSIGRTAIFGINLYHARLMYLHSMASSIWACRRFWTHSKPRTMAGLAIPQFEVKIVGVRKTVRAAPGLKVPIQPVGRQKPECVIIPAIACKTPAFQRDSLKSGTSSRIHCGRSNLCEQVHHRRNRLGI